MYGHSSHHVKGVEVYRGRLVLYGCGDLLTDYDGIRGDERCRGDLGLLYFVVLAPEDGRLVRLEMVPMRMSGFRLTRASTDDSRWLAEMRSREGERFGTSARVAEDGRLALTWDGSATHI